MCKFFDTFTDNLSVEWAFFVVSQQLKSVAIMTIKNGFMRYKDNLTHCEDYEHPQKVLYR